MTGANHPAIPTELARFISGPSVGCLAEAYDKKGRPNEPAHSQYDGRKSFERP